MLQRAVAGVEYAMRTLLFLESRYNLITCPVQVDGQSHVVHSEEEALGTRLTIDSLTCLLANEHDPSRLIASSPGKLVRHTVEDGGRVGTDQPYAEVEVRLKLPERAFISN